jgi:transposase
MTHIQFTTQDSDKLFEGFAKHALHKVRKKMLALYMKSQDFSHTDIARVCRISRPTLSEYLKDYKAHGIKKLKEIKFYKPESTLMEYEQQIKKHFEEHLPATCNEAREKIKALTDIQRCPTQIRTFLKRIGMKPRKVGYVPGKSDDPNKQNEQDEFKKKL